MYRLIPILALVGVFWLALPLESQPRMLSRESLLGTTAGVEFYAVDVYNDRNNWIGNEIHAKNISTVNKQVTIELGEESFNVMHSIPPGWFALEPGEKVYIGSIHQANAMDDDWNWNINWWVRDAPSDMNDHDHDDHDDHDHLGDDLRY